MDEFRRILSIAFKIGVAIALVSLCAYVAFVGYKRTVSYAARVSTKNAKYKENDVQMKKLYDSIDALHTTIPESEWNKLVVAAIHAHCALNGFSMDEVRRVLGKPSKVGTGIGGVGSTWTYEIIDKSSCIKYQGDECVEYRSRLIDMYLTPNGYLFMGETDEPECFREPFASTWTHARERWPSLKQF